jgi:hypothetical protein
MTTTAGDAFKSSTDKLKEQKAILEEQLANATPGAESGKIGAELGENGAALGRWGAIASWSKTKAESQTYYPSKLNQADGSQTTSTENTNESVFANDQDQQNIDVDVTNENSNENINENDDIFNGEHNQMIEQNQETAVDTDVVNDNNTNNSLVEHENENVIDNVDNSFAGNANANYDPRMESITSQFGEGGTNSAMTYYASKIDDKSSDDITAKRSAMADAELNINTVDVNTPYLEAGD